jgi:hypothetical protein
MTAMKSSARLRIADTGVNRGVSMVLTGARLLRSQ